MVLIAAEKSSYTKFKNVHQFIERDLYITDVYLCVDT